MSNSLIRTVPIPCVYTHDLCESVGVLPVQTNMAAGHFSQAGVFSQVMEQAERYAFIMWALSACPDGLSGAASQALVFDLITVFIGMGAILAVSGELGYLASRCSTLRVSALPA